MKVFRLNCDLYFRLTQVSDTRKKIFQHEYFP